MNLANDPQKRLYLLLRLRGVNKLSVLSPVHDNVIF